MPSYTKRDSAGYEKEPEEFSFPLEEEDMRIQIRTSRASENSAKRIKKTTPQTDCNDSLDELATAVRHFYKQIVFTESERQFQKDMSTLIAAMQIKIPFDSDLSLREPQRNSVVLQELQQPSEQAASSVRASAPRKNLSSRPSPYKAVIPKRATSPVKELASAPSFGKAVAPARPNSPVGKLMPGSSLAAESSDSDDERRYSPVSVIKKAENNRFSFSLFKVGPAARKTVINSGDVQEVTAGTAASYDWGSVAASAGQELVTGDPGFMRDDVDNEEHYAMNRLH